ncbi:uncharacterized protein LOC102618161 isoform X7 [Citrus sinensis]|uniref:uncharacterized protein LOC18045008 isoform X6 n=1 Tax=Citrus clementina TaxID=85681 RepID=UPI000CECF81F|nr:uncharacterized protein LOC18045008 isoform X6 [Citrus x clementina]XP_052296260.1 uncharacterized protein LOC102618161 isoform X7 [Citrus sinensis]
MMHSIGRSRNIGRIPSQAIIGIENVHSNMEKKDSMRGKKHCKPSKRLPTVTSCDRECGDIVNRELPFYKICLERGRYRVGPFVTPRPFGVQEERLINFCMDETLNEGEIVFRTNFNEITRNDIMSMSPRSIINLKVQSYHLVVSAVAEMLSVQGTIKVGERKFSLFMPAYNTLTSIDTTLDHGGSNVDCNSIKLRDFPIEFCSREPTIRNEYDCALYIMLMMDRHNMLSSLNSLCQFHSDAERVRIVIKLITCSFNFLKDNIASSSEIHQRRIDVAEQSFCKAIDKRRLRQLRRSRQMGHGPRH